MLKTKKLNSVAFSPQANYTDRATAACRRSQCQLLLIEGVAWSAQRIPAAVNFGFLDRSRYAIPSKNNSQDIHVLDYHSASTENSDLAYRHLFCVPNIVS
jgi:hypothetical protein